MIRKISFKWKWYYKNTASGSLLIHGDTVDLRPGSCDTGEVMLRAMRNAQVELRHDNSARVTTTVDGADIGGTRSLEIPVGTTAQRSGSPTAMVFQEVTLFSPRPFVD